MYKRVENKSKLIKVNYKFIISNSEGRNILKIKRNSVLLKKLIYSLVVFISCLYLSCSSLNLNDLTNTSSLTPNNLAEKAVGNVLVYKPYEQDFPTDPLGDKKIQDYVESVMNKLLPFSKNKAFDLELLKTARVQAQSAFAEEIDITRGMLNMIANEAELACVIGHEIGHADLGAQYKSQNEGWLSKFSTKALNKAGTALNQQELADQINQHRQDIMLASWSQADEQAADEYGAILAAKAGYDPYAFADLFNRLAQKVDVNAVYHFKELTSTHKALDVRAAHIIEFLKAKGYKQGHGIRGRTQYILAMADLVNIRTDEDNQVQKSQNTQLTPDQQQDLKDLTNIRDELLQYVNNGTKLPPKRFKEIMQRYSQFVQKNNISRAQLLAYAKLIEPPTVNNYNKTQNYKFLDATILDTVNDLNMWPLFDPNGPGGLSPTGEAFVDGMELIANLALGASDFWLAEAFINCYQANYGYDFFTGDKLSYNEQVLSYISAVSGTVGHLGSIEKSIDDWWSAMDEPSNISRC